MSQIHVKSAREVLIGNTLVEVVDFAIEVSRIEKRAHAEVEAVKPFLREAASHKATKTGETAIDLEGSQGVVQVVFPLPTVQAKKYASGKKTLDLLQLEEQLPETVFNDLFRKKTVVEFVDDAAGWALKIARLPAAQQALLNNFVEVVESTPRVSVGK